MQLFNKLLVLPNRYFDTHNSGHLISRITFNVTMVTGAATDAIKVVIREGLTVVFLFGYLLWMNWKLTLVMLAILPLIAMMVGSASKKFRKQSKKIQVAMGDVTHVASETIQGYRVVRSFGGETYEQQRFAEASQSNTDKQLRMTKTGAVYTPMLQLVIYTAMAVLMFLVLFLRGDAIGRRSGGLYHRWPACCPSRSASCRKSARPSRRAWPVPRASSNSWTRSLKSTTAPSSATGSAAIWKCAT